MEDRQALQAYVNNFRRHFSRYLRPGIGLSCNVYPVSDEGAILDFSIGTNMPNEDHFQPPQDSVNAVLRIVPQRIVAGNIEGIKFGGTNISMEPNRILIIKGENDTSLWSDEAAKGDVERIISGVEKRP